MLSSEIGIGQNQPPFMTTIPGTVNLVTTLGHRITVFENDVIGRNIARTGLYEKEIVEYLNRLLDKMSDAVVLDIGANIGNHALAFSTQAKQVYAFEPLPQVFGVLEKNVRQNSIQNIQAFQLALSSANGTATIYQNKSGNIGASSFDRRGQGESEAVTVQKKTGDQVVADLQLARIDLIKLDVEAHESYVLQGLMTSLEKFRPFIMMEWADQLTIERLSQSPIMDFLYREFDIHVLGSKHERMYWEGKSYAWVKRKLARLLLPREAILYDFDPSRLYRNLLLIPKDKRSLLPTV